MTGRVVAVPERVHRCSPGWTYSEMSPGDHGYRAGYRRANPPPAHDYPAGTVWECECGRAWVSTGPPNAWSPGFTDFRPERRGERRRRLRTRQQLPDYALIDRLESELGVGQS